MAARDAASVTRRFSFPGSAIEKPSGAGLNSFAITGRAFLEMLPRQRSFNPARVCVRATFGRPIPGKGRVDRSR